MTANQFLQRIRDVSCRKPDVIPPGWMDARQFAVKWRVSLHSSRRSLSYGVRGGVAEKKRFLVRIGRSTVRVSYFRPVEKKSVK